MIQEVPFAIYIKDDKDISLNSLPSSIEIIPHEASIVMDEAIIVNRIYCVNRLWVINKLAYICNKFILVLFMISCMMIFMSLLFTPNIKK
jgi:hypothetical protein